MPRIRKQVLLYDFLRFWYFIGVLQLNIPLSQIILVQLSGVALRDYFH